jgi:hypothetical protein
MKTDKSPNDKIASGLAKVGAQELKRNLQRALASL